MSFALTIGLLSGGLRLMTAGCIMLRQVLYQPDRPNYPAASKRLQLGLFLLGAILLFNAVDVIWRSWTDPGHKVLISALPLSAIWCVVEVLQVERILRQWLPSRLQVRISKWLHLASCANRDQLTRERARNVQPLGGTVYVPPSSVVAPALAELALSGMAVIGPMEGPEVVRDLNLPAE